MALERVRPKEVWQDRNRQEYINIVWPNGDEETFKSIHVQKKGGQ